MIASGPKSNVICYKGYVINRKRFHIKDAEKSTQNSGVMLDATTVCRSSARDNAQVIDVISYYGVIREISILDYFLLLVPLFKCNWTIAPTGIKVVEGLTLVNIPSQFGNDHFIFASQAKQVFYARESDSSNWSIVQKALPRGFHDLEEVIENVTNCHRNMVSWLNYRIMTLVRNAVMLGKIVKEFFMIKLSHVVKSE